MTRAFLLKAAGICALFCCGLSFGQTRQPEGEVLVEIVEKQLMEFIPVAEARIPVKTTEKVTDLVFSVFTPSGEELPCAFNGVDPTTGEAVVLFRTSPGQHKYAISWQKGPLAGKPAWEPVRTGTVVIDDYLHPSAKTSGSWLWLTEPVLSGVFSQSNPLSQIGYRSTAIVPSPPISPESSLVTYLFIDPAHPSEEIVIEVVCGQNRKAFSFGADKITWAGITKVKQGELPLPGKWQRISIPLKEMGRSGPVTGIGFYHYGGQVVWDRISIDDAPLKTVIRQFRAQGKPLSAYFTSTLSPTFRLPGSLVALLEVDASTSTGASLCEWQIDSKPFSGKQATASLVAGRRSEVVLKVYDGSGASDTFVRTFTPPSGAAVPVEVTLRPLPHANVVRPGEEAWFSFHLSSETPCPIPVTLSFGGRRIPLTLLPRKENAQIHHIPLVAKATAETAVASVSLGEAKLADATVRFLQMEPGNQLAAAGPFLRSSDGSHAVLLMPASPPVSEPVARGAVSLLLAGDFPEGFARLLQDALKKSGCSPKVDTLPLPSSAENPTLLPALCSWPDLLSGKRYDICVFSSPVRVLATRPPVEEWARQMEALAAVSAAHCRRTVVLSPFPSAPYPAAMLPYVEALQKACAHQKIPFLNVHRLTTAMPAWENWFELKQNLFGPLPNIQGAQVIVDRLIPLLVQ